MSRSGRRHVALQQQRQPEQSQSEHCKRRAAIGCHYERVPQANPREETADRPRHVAGPPPAQKRKRVEHPQEEQQPDAGDDGIGQRRLQPPEQGRRQERQRPQIRDAIEVFLLCDIGEPVR